MMQCVDVLSLGKRWLLWSVMMGWRWRSFFLRDAHAHTASPSLTHNALQVWAQIVLMMTSSPLSHMTVVWSHDCRWSQAGTDGGLPDPGRLSRRQEYIHISLIISQIHISQHLLHIYTVQSDHASTNKEQYSVLFVLFNKNTLLVHVSPLNIIKQL